MEQKEDDIRKVFQKVIIDDLLHSTRSGILRRTHQKKILFEILYLDTIEQIYNSNTQF